LCGNPFDQRISSLKVNFNIVSFRDSFRRKWGKRRPGRRGRQGLPCQLFCFVASKVFLCYLFVCVRGAFGDRKIPSLIWPR
jgi:hypothetical protein